jgi:hypothetical protein
MIRQDFQVSNHASSEDTCHDFSERLKSPIKPENSNIKQGNRKWNLPLLPQLHGTEGTTG